MDFFKNLLRINSNNNKCVILVRDGVKKYQDKDSFVVDDEIGTITFKKNVCDGVKLKGKILHKNDETTNIIGKQTNCDIYVSENLLNNANIAVEHIVLVVNEIDKSGKAKFNITKDFGHWIKLRLKSSGKNTEENKDANICQTIATEASDENVNSKDSGNIINKQEDDSEEERVNERATVVDNAVMDGSSMTSQEQTKDLSPLLAEKEDSSIPVETKVYLTEKETKEVVCKLLIRVFTGTVGKDGDETLEAKTKKAIKELLGNFIQNELESCVKKDEITELNRELNRNVKQLTDKMGEFVQKSSLASEVENVLQPKINGINDSINRMSTSVNAKIDKDDFENRYSELKELVNEIKEKYENSDVGQLNQKVEELETEINHKDEEIKGDKLQIITLENDNENKSKKITKLDGELKSKVNELTNTKKELEVKKKELQISENTCKNQAKEITEKKGIISKQKEQIDLNNEEIEDKKQKIAGLESRVSDLDSQVSSLQSDNKELSSEQDNNSKNIYCSFINGLGTIKSLLESEELFLPCADNQDDCVEIQKSLLTKISEFSNKANKKIDSKAKPSFIEETITGMIKDELTDKRSWMYEVAKYMIYSRHGFSIDTEREKGIALKKETITKLWNELDAILAVHKFRLITPDLFADTVSEISGVEDVTGMRSSLDNLVPNSNQYLENVSRVRKDGVIRDCVELGYIFDGKIVKNTKVIR